MEINNYPLVYPVWLTGELDVNSLSINNSINASLIVNRRYNEYPDDYNIFSDDNGNIILAVSNFLKSYTYTLNIEDSIYPINNALWDEIKYFIDLPIENASGVFTFVDSKPIANLASGRCDLSMKGPSAFIRDEDSPISNVFNSTFISSMGEIKSFQPIMSIDGVGHIIYVSYDSAAKEDFDINENNMPKATRTIFELLKLMLEWRELKSDPWFSNENIVLSVDNFFDQLQLPLDIKNQIFNTQCDMQIARYLKGSLNARLRPPLEEIESVPTDVYKWLASKCFHSGIDKLIENLT